MNVQADLPSPAFFRPERRQNQTEMRTKRARGGVQTQELRRRVPVRSPQQNSSFGHVRAGPCRVGTTVGAK